MSSGQTRQAFQPQEFCQKIQNGDKIKLMLSRAKGQIDIIINEEYAGVAFTDEILS